MNRIISAMAVAFDASRWHRFSDRRIALALLVSFAILYTATATYTHVQINDTRSAALAAWSFANHGSLALPAEYPRALAYWGVEAPDGRIYSNRFPTIIAWAVPFYAVHRLLSPGAGSVVHPFLAPYGPAGLAGALAAAAGVALLFVVFRRVATFGPSLAATMIVGLATPVWSVAADALWPHSVTVPVLALSMLAVSRPAGGTGLAAFGAAIAVMTRPHLAAATGALALGELVQRRWGRGIVIVVGTCVGLALLTWYSWSIFGTPLPAAGYRTEALTGRLLSDPIIATARNIFWSLAHPLRGILVITPFLILLVPGVPAAWRAAPRWVRYSALAGLLYYLVQMRVIRFSGGYDFFGYRTSIEALILASPLLLLAWKQGITRRKPWRGAFRALVAASLVLHLVGGVFLPYSGASFEAGRRDLERLEAGDDPLLDDPWVRRDRSASRP